MTPAEALNSLPHGPGFRFVEEILWLNPGQSAEGRYKVRGDEPFLSAHFPGNPVVPGVILLEALAQLGGVVAQSDPELPPLRDLLLAAVQSAKITGSGIPGDFLTIQATVTGRWGALVQIEGEIKIGTRTILTARITLSGGQAE